MNQNLSKIKVSFSLLLAFIIFIPKACNSILEENYRGLM